MTCTLQILTLLQFDLNNSQKLVEVSPVEFSFTLKEESKMEPKPKGGIHTLVRVTDQNGNEYVCPITALRNPNSLTEEEKAHCETSGPQKPEAKE